MGKMGKALVVCCLLMPALGVAHPGHHVTELGAVAGLLHPLTGIDHLLALIAMGLWTSQLDGPTARAAPIAFVLAVALGAELTPEAVALVWRQMAVSASVVLLGGLVASTVTVSGRLAIPLAALVGLGHGALHTGAAGDAVWGASYVVGLTVATAVGVALSAAPARRLRAESDAPLVRAIGGAIAAVGLAVTPMAFVGLGV